MFGYVSIYKPELKIKDYESYKGVYCTLCKTMGKKFGISSRLLLSYDATFYAVFRLALEDNNSDICKSRCTFNPTKKCIKIKNEEDVFNESAALTIILAYFKLLDNIKDSKWPKKLLYKIIKPYFYLKAKKAKRLYPAIYDICQKAVSDQDSAEKDNASIDLAAHPTAQMLKSLISLHYENDDIQRFAYMLGRVIYFMDAFDDFEKDIKTDSFNPFDKNENITQQATLSINTSIGEMAELLNSFKIYKYKAVLENVIIYGFSNKLKQISQKYGGEISESI